MRKKTYSTNDIAELCDFTINTVVNWTKGDSLPAYKTKGGHRRIKEADLTNFLIEHNMPVLPEKRILVVDDDAAIRQGLKELFESNGYNVDVADNGFKAGKLFTKKRPKLVILDLVMPGIDGLEVCKDIKESETGKQTKIILLTGFPSKENIAKAKKLGINKCLAKPIDASTLLKEVSTFCKKSSPL